MKLYIDEILDESYLSKFKDLGVEQYCILYQNSVNADHNSADGTIDVDEIIKRIESDTAGEGGCKFSEARVVLLDFENPYSEFVIFGKTHTKIDSRGNEITFDTIRSTLVNTIETLKARYPDKRWGYYGFPHPIEWLCCSETIVNPSCECPIRLDQANEEQLLRASEFFKNNCQEIVDSCHIFGPDLYQRDLRNQDIYGNDALDKAKAVFSASLCKSLDANNTKEKLCWISPFFFKELMVQEGTVRGFEIISDDELFSETIDPWIAGGMNGFLVWVAMRYRFAQLTSPLSADENYAMEQKALRITFNRVFMNETGSNPSDDAFWTDDARKPLFKTIFTEQLYKFCERVVARIKQTTNKPEVIASPMSIEQAQKAFNDKFRVVIGFDGEETVASNSAGEFRRAVGWGGEESTFTWKRFITLEDNFNPTPGQLNPWSLKKWYKWGVRKFHFHNPFGKVARGKSQELVYEVDQFLNAKNGLTINGEVQNTKMPWLVNDFVAVVKALTTGQQGTLDQATWDSWTTGADAWFNPLEPIDLIVYIGSLADPHPSDVPYGVYIDRWEEHFKRSPTGALNRLKASVQPLIDANCRIAFDAACVAAGPIPGKNIPFERQCLELQKGWWSFWKWINRKIGKDRVYIESHPFKTNGEANPYLGTNIISDDDWSTSLCCPAEPNGLGGPHMTSEMGDVEFIRCLWQTAPTRTPLISRTDANGLEIPERYWFLKDVPSVVEVKSEYTGLAEKRLSSPTCCAPGHNYNWHDVFSSIIAYHLLEKQNIRGETNEIGNITRSSILVPNTLMQILPPSYDGDPRHLQQFAAEYSSSEVFIKYIATLIEAKKASEGTMYVPY